MENKISIELFEAVMGFRIAMPPIFEGTDRIGYLVYGRQDSPALIKQNHKQISINDFLTKCKTWLFIEKNVMFDIRYRTNVSPRYISILTYGKSSSYYHGQNEFEAIIKLCNAIIKE